MRNRLLSSTLLCTLFLPGSSVAASRDSRQAQALWLSGQLHRPIEASQVLVSPDAGLLDGCTITRSRAVPIGATALSLRCPSHALPQLVLLKLSVEANSAGNPSSFSAPSASSTKPSRTAPPIVRAGAALQADWRTDSLHAELPVVALDSGASGAEIRVRVAGSNRTMRARILSNHNVTIVDTGA
jgi:hypothetical protein